MEYYMSDLNLASDGFFREKIESNENGYIELAIFMRCNKVKKMNITIGDIVGACEDSESVEFSDDYQSIRRKDNKPLPGQEGGNLRKRDRKAQGKETSEDQIFTERPQSNVRPRKQNGRPGILGAIGNTPLIEIDSLSKATGCKIMVKCEQMNPCGSHKDRIALWMVEEAEKNGDLKPGGTIVEATAGNTG